MAVPRSANRYQEDPISGGPPPPRSSNSSSGSNERRTTRSPIGVPDDYYTTGPPRGITDISIRGAENYGSRPLPEVRRRPQYFDGDEFRPAAFSVEKIIEIQRNLARTGLLTGPFTLGTWDPSTQAAYADLLGMANGSGDTAERTLAQMLAISDVSIGQGGGIQWQVDPETGELIPVSAGEGGQGPPALVTRKTDPQVLRSVFRRAVIEMAGEGWGADQIDRMAQAYNQLEVQRQQEMYDAQLAAGQGVSGGVVDIPSPDAWIQSEVERRDPEGVETNKALGFVNDFMSMAGNTAYGVGG